MVELEIRVSTADGVMTTFVVRPDGTGPFPVAVVYMDAVGYREQIKKNARRFAAGGYYCVAPDLFYRSGQALSFDFSKLREEGMTGPEAKRMLSVAHFVTADGVVADTRAIFAAISSDSAARLGPKVCVGYCMGAELALHVASALTDDFIAAAGIHPGELMTDAADSPHLDLAGVRGELYFLFAEIDRGATAEQVDQFRQELIRNRVRGAVERFPGTTHGFAMADLPVYNREGSEHHYERTLDLWKRNLSRSLARA